jgi:hypothetical protein
VCESVANSPLVNELKSQLNVIICHNEWDRPGFESETVEEANRTGAQKQTPCSFRWFIVLKTLFAGLL